MFQTLGFTIQYINIAADLLILNVFPLQYIHIVDDGCQRRLNIMGNICDQICLQTFTLHLLI